MRTLFELSPTLDLGRLREIRAHADDLVRIYGADNVYFEVQKNGLAEQDIVNAGRPITYGTTEDFLSHFGLEQLGDLPGLEELKGSGLLDHRLPPGFAVPMPSDDPQLRDDEDPLEPGDLDLGLAPPPERVEE